MQAYRTVLQTDVLPPFNVTGSMEVDVHSSTPTHCVVLHAVGMELDSFTALTSTNPELEGGAQHVPVSLEGTLGSIVQAALLGLGVFCRTWLKLCHQAHETWWYLCK